MMWQETASMWPMSAQDHSRLSQLVAPAIDVRFGLKAT
jgi:hypothetical protein